MSPEDQARTAAPQVAETSTNLITQGSRLHGSSKLYNHRAQGCEGELGVAAVSCGAHFSNAGLIATRENLLTQHSPAEFDS
jgi:hypothetical protein